MSDKYLEGMKSGLALALAILADEDTRYGGEDLDLDATLARVMKRGPFDYEEEGHIKWLPSTVYRGAYERFTKALKRQFDLFAVAAGEDEI